VMKQRTAVDIASNKEYISKNDSVADCPFIIRFEQLINGHSSTLTGAAFPLGLSER
jgi:hypothetical protein